MSILSTLMVEQSIFYVKLEKEMLCRACRHIPDVRARTSHLFLALNRRGDFKIWSDEFEDLCDVIAKEVESPPDLKQLRRRASRSEMQFVTHPVYSYVMWAFTLGSLAVAITQFNVSPSFLKVSDSLI